MPRSAMFDAAILGSTLGDSLAIDTSVNQAPLSPPTHLAVKSVALGNELKGQFPTDDARVKAFAVYSVVRADPAVQQAFDPAGFVGNTTHLPYLHKQSGDTDTVKVKRDYWLVSLNANYVYFGTLADVATYLGVG